MNYSQQVHKYNLQFGDDLFFLRNQTFHCGKKTGDIKNSAKKWSPSITKERDSIPAKITPS